MKKISVIIPVWNTEKYVGECIDSILAQSIVKDLEIICVNDGSTDSSLEILRRYEKEESNKLQAGNVIIDLDASRVYVGQEEIVFTALEYKILVLLFSNMGKTVTRENILDKIWDVAGNFVNDNTLTVYVKRIRAKLGENDVIKTIKGIGYRVEK